jgi:anthranilate synthase component I
VAHIQVGAGIVADSDPATEYQETLNKANAVLAAVAEAERMEGCTRPSPSLAPLQLEEVA